MILLQLIFLILQLIVQSSGNKSAKFYELTRRSPATDSIPMQEETMRNFARVLDTLLNSLGYEPLAMSIGHYGNRREDIWEAATKYARDRSLDVYQFDLKNVTSLLPIGLTWIIMTDDPVGFTARAREMSNLWESANRLAILSLDDRQESPWMSTLFRFLWHEKRLVKVAISPIGESFRYIYRYAPFARIGKIFGQVQRFALAEVPYCNDRLTIGCPIPKNSSELFENFRNLNGYPVNVTVFPSLMMKITTDKNNHTVYSLLDASIMNVIEKYTRANFVMDIHSLNEDSDKFETALRKVDDNGTTDIILTGYFTKVYNNHVYQFTTAVFQDRLCLVAPASKEVPKFFMPLLPFTRELWCLLLFYNFIVIFMWLIVRRFEALIKGRTHGIGTLGIELSIKTRKLSERLDSRVLGFPAYRSSMKALPRTEMDRSSGVELDGMKVLHEPPRINRTFIGFFNFFLLACSPLQGGKTNAERAFLIGTLFFSLIVVGLYQSCLVSSLSDPIYYPQLRTLRDVVESRLPIVTKWVNLIDNMASGHLYEDETWSTRVQLLKSKEATYSFVAYRNTIALSRSASFKLEDLTQYHKPESNRFLLHMVEECPDTYHLSYVVRKNLPYLERINMILMRIRQSGLITKWYHEMQRTVKTALSRNESKQRGNRVKLTLTHLSLTFLLLGIGLFFSTVVFIGEIYFASRYRSATVRIAIRRT